jgi:hypothetical protein
MEHVLALREEWLAQLSQTIESAQRLAWQLGTNLGASVEARELYGRLEAARLELESLRGLRAQPLEADPECLAALGWSGRLLDPD